MYYRITDGSNLIALACASPRLILAHSVPNPEKQIVYNKNSAIITDGPAISNAPNVCTADMIISQLGAPIYVDKTDDNSTVLVYQGSVFKQIR